MQRNAGDGTTTWSVDEKKLNQQLDEGDPTIAAAPKTGVGDAIDATGRLDANGAAQETSEGTVETSTAEEASVLPAKPEILPDESPDEQYRFALGKALQNDLETAENAFAEFRLFNKGHSREADAAFWLGRVQFMRGSYEKAAMTFSEFNSEYPNDARLVDTTMWIAESVSHFAPQDQACAIYASLPSLLDSPPESFTTQLAKLSAASNCDS
jgi:TolA-binding protein